MLLKLENPKIFVDLISIISELVTEVRLKVNQEGMSLNAIDPATVAMVYFKIPSELFSQFQLKERDSWIKFRKFKSCSQKMQTWKLSYSFKRG